MTKELSFPQRLIKEVGVEHTGGNFILDKGAPVEAYTAYIQALAEYMQLIKLGWTTWSLFTDIDFKLKIAAANEKNIPICLGGTLFEISHTEGMYPDLLDFLVDSGIKSIEVAGGFAVEIEQLPQAIEMAKNRGLSVMVEVGYKDADRDAALTVPERIAQIRAAKAAGADHLVMEAREIGEGYSVFKQNKSDNERLTDQVLEIFPLEQVVFEAPTRANQIQLVKTLGPNVNMGNIPFEEIPRVETIRRGLHADTYAATRALKKGGE